MPVQKMNYTYNLWLIIILVLVQCCYPNFANTQVVINAPAGNGESNYQWFRGTTGTASPIIGETAASLVTSTPGTYFATYDNAGCGGTTDYTIVVDACDKNRFIILNTDSNTGTFLWFKDNMTTGVASSSITVEAKNTVSTYHAETTMESCTITLPSFTIINLQNCVDCISKAPKLVGLRKR